MRKVIVSEFVSLDGVMEGPGGDDGFVRGAWTMPYWCDELAVYKTAELAASDAQLLGRRTYEGFAMAWPDRDDDDFARRINAATKYVVSSTLTDPTWGPVEVLRGGDDLAAEVQARKERDGADILVAGSWTLVQALLAAGLVDELHLAVYPVVLGTGRRLFGEGERLDWELVEASTTPTGVQLLTLRATEAPAAQEFDYESMTERG